MPKNGLIEGVKPSHRIWWEIVVIIGLFAIGPFAARSCYHPERSPYFRAMSQVVEVLLDTKEDSVRDTCAYSGRDRRNVLTCPLGTVRPSREQVAAKLAARGWVKISQSSEVSDEYDYFQRGGGWVVWVKVMRPDDRKMVLMIVH